MRTIKQFTSKTNKVYFFMKDNDTCIRFYADAEEEGIKFCGEKPTDKKPTDIIALLPNGDLCFVGWAGHMCYHNCKDGVIRIDYAKYADGEAEYLIK